MSKCAATWVLFAGVCTGMPILFYAFMYMAVVPLVGIPAIICQDPGVAIVVVSAFNLLIYGSLYYFACRLIVMGLFAISGKARSIVVVVLSVSIASQSFRPIYGGCYVGCDHVSLAEFYAQSLHAG